MNKLIIYRNLLNDPLINKFVSLINKSENSQETYFSLIHELIITENYVHDYLIKKIVETENKLTIKLEASNYQPSEEDYIYLQNDLSIIKNILLIDADMLCIAASDENCLLANRLKSPKPNSVIKAYLDFFNSIDNHTSYKETCNIYIDLCKLYGIGAFVFHQAFYFTQNEIFRPIIDFNPLPWENIYGYSYQKQQLYDNTHAFVNCVPFHNVLLVGSAGTGKSSSVKALVNLFIESKLRLLQMHKGQLNHLPKVLEQIASRAFKFIIFIDDLSFEANEDEYKFLKSFIEGSIVNDADNIAFYITSNRRHLIREIRSERENDIHLNDFIQEMTSLSDRFGLTLFYEAPDQKVFIEMVDKMLRSRGEIINKDKLTVMARQWSLEHGGMSGRTAEQFVKHVIMQKAMLT